MNTEKSIAGLLLSATLLMAAPIPTRSGNNLRTGLYPDTTLTPAAVAQRGLRVYFHLPMEGDARGTESQPLIAEQVTVQDGRRRNLLLVSALNNLVWTYDADTSDIVWVQKAGISVKSNNSIDYWGINDHVGFLSTGVIDTETNIWYGVAVIAPDSVPQHGIHYVVGLNLRDGSQAFPPVQMPAEYDAVMRKQRSSLALAKLAGMKLVLWGSGTQLETSSTSAGYLAAFDTASHKVTLMPMAKQGGGAGIWMSGSGLIVDETKQAIFGVTGNGTFDPQTGDWAETAFRATFTSGGFQITDWFTPYLDKWRAANSPLLETQRLSGHSLSTAKQVNGEPVNAGHTLNGHQMPPGAAMGDEDWGSAQGFYLPQYQKFGVSGKDGILLMMNAFNMGKTLPSDLAAPAAMTENYKKLASPPIWFSAYAGNGFDAGATNAQTLNNNVWFDGKTHHVHMEPVVDTATSYVYVGGENSNVRAWKANADGTMTYLANSDDVASPDLANTPHGGMTGWFCAGASSGVLVCARPHGDANRYVVNGDVFVFDSRNFDTRPDGSKRLKVLWRSDQPGHGQNQPIKFVFNKFDPPIIWNGKIYIPTYDGNYGTMVLGLN